MKKMRFKPVEAHPDFFQKESKTIKFWKKNRIFERSIEQRSKDDLYSFYDGPPFVTGTPHYGTLLSSIAKDLIPRYFTMKGKRIRRVWGWDCHGLPIENKVEEKLGLKNRRDIEKIGLKKFIKGCYDYVSSTSPEWQWYIDHVGRWVDFENSYKTMDQDYMETVIWVFKQIYDKGLIYKGKRVSLYCPRCGTPVSNFEIAMDNSYVGITEFSNVYKYKLVDEKNTYILAWSTTPWNKIATPALAVNPKLTYIKVKQGNEYYILAEKTKKILKDKPAYKVIKKMKGKSLEGLKFEPHYDYWPREKGKKAYEVFVADFVTAEEGTGVVTIAAYGEDDFKLMKEKKIQMIEHVNGEGKLKPEVRKWPGKYYLDVDLLVNKDLRKRHLMYREDPYTHTIPVCWRCKTRLIYAPQDAWFIRVSELKDQLLKTNKNVNWVPKSANNRFIKGIENAPDWCISRTRYWATPMPIWECQKCNERKIVGSIAEIERLSGQKVKDLHRPFIDKITFKCQKCQSQMRRVKEVLDCWMESGSMPYGERHYPFENKKEFEQGFPADYISEYVAQTRAWFYVMHVVSNALMKTHCFKNVVVTGVIMGSDGRKMSKSYGNFPDPKKTLGKYGGDALRLYLMESPIMVGENINISEEGIKNAYRTTLLILWNSYRYFVTFANLAKFNPKTKVNSDHVLDKWIKARFKKLYSEVTHSLDKYEVPPVVNEITDFIKELSTWYIRRSRKKFNQFDQKTLSTLYWTLVELTKVAAPIIPFVTEDIFKNLTNQDSVHLQDWPKLLRLTNEEKKLLKQMELVREVCELGHAERKELKIKVRQPLQSIKVKINSLKPIDELIQLIKDELNVKDVVWQKIKEKEAKVLFNTKITQELKEEGESREIIRLIQAERKKAKCRLDQKVIVYIPNWPKRFENQIRQKTLAKKLIQSKEFRLVK